VESINWAAEQELLAAPLLGVKPARLYVVIRGRNAWHSTWVQNYSGPYALSVSFHAAAAHAERRRKQGSVFYISEVPGIALQSEEGPVALVEFHSDNCFGKWDLSAGVDYLQLGTPIGAVMRSLGPYGHWRGRIPSKHSFITGKANWGSVALLEARKPLKRWQSRSVGGQYALDWEQYRSRYTRAGVNKVIRAFEAVNPEGERLEAERAYWQAEGEARARARRRAQARADELIAIAAETTRLLDEIATGWDEPE
jgi:hypothetical protein